MEIKETHPNQLNFSNKNIDSAKLKSFGTHFILPYSVFIKTLNKEIDQRFGRSKIYKVNKNTIKQEYSYGGLKRIGFAKFSSALKSS